MSIDMEYVRNHPNEPWDKFGLSYNKQFTMKDIDTLILPNSIHEWYWQFISQYINIQEVINNPHQPWDKDGLICNDDGTLRILEFFNAGLLKHLQKEYTKVPISHRYICEM